MFPDSADRGLAYLGNKTLTPLSSQKVLNKGRSF